MESKWYLFPGQTLENTKIADRVHALHINESAWKGITRHLDRHKIIQQTVEKEQAVKKYLREGSKNMTRKWENSLENVRRRKEEERLKAIAQKKDDRMQKFLEMRKEQDEMRRQYTEKVKKQIFMSTGAARDLTSALITSEVLYERGKQIELQNKINRHEIEEQEKYDKIIQQEAQMESKIKMEQEFEKKEKNKKHGQILKTIIDEKQRLAKKLKEDQIEQEAEDNKRAAEETEVLDAMKAEEKLVRKRELKIQRKAFLDKQEEKRKQEAKEAKELEEVVQIYKNAKHRIDCMRKKREKEMQDAILKRREEVVKLVYAAEKDRTEAEERAIKAAIEERDAKEMEMAKAREELQKKMRDDKIKNRQEVLDRETEKRKKDIELKKWELINRYKTDEVMKKYEENRRKQRWNEILNYRQELINQMEEEREVKLREKELDEAFVKANWDDDSKFFEYAREVLEMAKKKGRSTIPIEKVITKYLKQRNISNDLDNRTNNDDTIGALKRHTNRKMCRCLSVCQ